MIRIFYIIIFLFVFGLSGSRAQDTIKPDTLKLGTIAFDEETYRQFKDKEEFNYMRERPEESQNSRFKEWLYRMLRKLLNRNMSDKQLNWVLIISLTILALLIAFLVYRFNPSLFYRGKRLELDYRIEDEEEGIDPDKKIRQALDAGDFPEAIRWNYRKLLAILHNKDYISYDPNKTVNEYVNEIADTELRKLFRKLSVAFVFYRYGNGKADQAVYDNFDLQSKALIKQLR